MSFSFTGVISVSFYLVILLVVVCLTKLAPALNITAGKHVLDNSRFNFFYIIIIALLCVGLNWFATSYSVSMGGDRTNYYSYFRGVRTSDSIGLQLLMNLFHLISSDFVLFLLSVCFCCMIITLLAYRISTQATATAVILLFCSQYLFTTFVNMKQCWADALAAVFFAVMLGGERKHRNLICILLIVIAFLFHASAIVLLPLFLICGSKRRKNIPLYFIIALLVVVFIQPISVFIINLFSGVFPGLTSLMNQYFVEGTGEESGTLLTLIKGIPVYIIVIYAFIYRKSLEEKIDDYDNYLIIALFAAFVYVLGSQFYWLSRLIYLFYFPIYILWGQIVKNTRQIRNVQIANYVVYGSTLFFTLRYLILIYLNYGGF